jgi:hypothetical protein
MDAIPTASIATTRRADMIRTIAYSLLAIVVFGVVATPGLAAFALLAVPLVVLAAAWRVALAVVTRGCSSEVVVRAKHCQLLGPGGPDDFFVAHVLDEDERWAEVTRADAA